MTKEEKNQKQLRETYVDSFGFAVLVMTLDGGLIDITKEIEANVMYTDDELSTISWCTLEEIEKYLLDNYSIKRKDGSTHQPLAYVVSEMGLSGVIYRYGNYGEVWDEWAKTRGYA